MQDAFSLIVTRQRFTRPSNISHHSKRYRINIQCILRVNQRSQKLILVRHHKYYNAFSVAWFTFHDWDNRIKWAWNLLVMLGVFPELVLKNFIQYAYLRYELGHIFWIMIFISIFLQLCLHLWDQTSKTLQFYWMSKTVDTFYTPKPWFQQ